MSKKLILLLLSALLQINCSQVFASNAQIKGRPATGAMSSSSGNAGNAGGASNAIDQGNSLNSFSTNSVNTPKVNNSATDAMPTLRGLESSQIKQGASGQGLQSSASISERAGTATGTGASVESYFMTGPNRDGRGLQMQPQTIVYGPNPNQGHKKHGFLWHLFDNLGVPMFGNNDLEIDPSIKTVYVIPPPKLPSERAIMKERNQTTANSTASTTTVQAQEASQNAQPTQHKIPESELEGTIYESPASKDMPSPGQ